MTISGRVQQSQSGLCDALTKDDPQFGRRTGHDGCAAPFLKLSERPINERIIHHVVAESQTGKLDARAQELD